MTVFARIYEPDGDTSKRLDFSQTAVEGPKSWTLFGFSIP
jgi:hypothetical protein